MGITVVPREIKIKLQPKKLNGPRKSRCIDEIFYIHHVTVTWLMWCLRYFQFECLLHLQSQAAQALHLKLDEFEFSQYFIEINKENTSLNLPFVCSCGGLVWQNVLPLNYLKVGFKWLSTQWCAFAICISSIIPWVLTICKDISVKKFWQMVLVLKRLRKEKCVGVVPFAKHQKTCEKEMCQSYTICKTPDNVWPLVKTNHPPAQKEAWHWSNQTIMVTKTTVVSVKSGKKGIPRKVLLFLPENFHRDERFIWILHGITGFSIQMVSAPCLPHRGPLKNALMPLG